LQLGDGDLFHGCIEAGENESDDLELEVLLFGAPSHGM
jgi:hypothetical protein